jgi:hypothetical protein
MRKRWRSIPTIAFGHQFRSRLEVRWACVLTCLGWKWEYEQYLVKVSSRKHYLCDFYISPQEKGGGPPFWLEIKPKSPTKVELKKALSLVEQTGNDLAFGIGSPMHDAEIKWVISAHTPVSPSPFRFLSHKTLLDATQLYEKLVF